MSSRNEAPKAPLAALSIAFGLIQACAAPPHSAEIPKLTTTAEVLVDGTSSDLVPIGWLSVSRSQDIAFAQTQDGAVVLHDSTGASLGRLGRMGSGPGEFRELSRGGWISDSVWVIDGNLQRVSVGTADGFVRSFPSPTLDTAGARGTPRSLLRTYSTVELLSGDTIVGMANPFGPTVAGTLDGRRATVILVTREGRIVRAVGQPARDEGRVPIVAEGFSPGSIMRTPFHAGPLWSVSGPAGRVVFAETRFHSSESGEYHIVALRLSGDTAFSRTFAFTSPAIPPETMDSALARLFPATFAGAASLRDQLKPPVAYPPLSQVIAGNDGSTWIGLRPTGGLRPWIVLDSTGALVGRLELDQRDQLRDATLDRAWVTRRSDDGIESVMRYRVTR